MSPRPDRPPGAAAPAPPPEPALPIEPVLADVAAALAASGTAVLEAEPGAGKTTRVPWYLWEHRPDRRIVLLEPRRIAARAAATRLAAQLGEEVGQTVGLTTRDDRRGSSATRIEVVTEGVVLRRLQRDPGLGGVDLLIFDEFHERSLEADLSLAFTLDVREALRPDLQVLVMSATIEGPRVASLLNGSPLITAPGRSHPIDIEHRPSPSGWSGLPPAVADAANDLLTDGDVLVFVPGAGEIRAVIRYLEDVALAGDPVVLPLHGSLSGADQDAALRPAPAGRRKVVVATDVAESSITIDGICGVVDAGQSREPRFDATTGMTGLVTVPASRASAEQRAGRAGRQGPGRCIRLWPEREHAARDAHPRPAISTDDLTGAALEIAAWGADPEELALLDPPPAAAWERAVETLRELAAVDADGRITSHGRDLNALPAHPRLGHLLLRGRDAGQATLACDLAAVLSDRDLFVVDRDHPSADLAARVRVLRGERPPAGVRVRRGAVGRARKDAARYRRQLGDAPAGSDVRSEARGADDPDGAGRLVAAAWPERIAGIRDGQRGRFLLAGGRGATLADGDVLAGEAYLAVAQVDRGQREARIHLAAALDLRDLRDAVGDRVDVEEVVVWRDGDVVAERRERLGALVLAAASIEGDTPAARYDALLDGLRAEGLQLLGWDDDARELRDRVRFLRRHQGASWPAWDDASLLESLEDVVGPFLLQARRRADLADVRMVQVLRSRLSREQLRDLDRLAPTHLTVPSGSRVRLDYAADGAPVLAVRVQEVFGSRSTPAVLDGQVPVLLHLLSPARRPVQVTDDLAGFWERSYPQVRAELRGRYPKHAWPEDPTAAAPLRGTRRRR